MATKTNGNQIDTKAHASGIKDTDDFHFIIDAKTREIKRATPSGASPSVDKRLRQYDHNSERFTFEVPRYIEGHDMLKSDVKVHFSNVDESTRVPFSSYYPVLDLKTSASDPNNKLEFSWLVENASTQYVGLLNFAVSFECFGVVGKNTDGTDKIDLSYRWGTGIYNSLYVDQTMRYDDEVYEIHQSALIKLESSYAAYQKEIDETIATIPEVVNESIQEQAPDIVRGELNTYKEDGVINLTPTKFAETDAVKKLFNTGTDQGSGEEIKVIVEDFNIQNGENGTIEALKSTTAEDGDLTLVTKDFVENLINQRISEALAALQENSNN